MRTTEDHQALSNLGDITYLELSDRHDFMALYQQDFDSAFGDLDRKLYNPNLPKDHLLQGYRSGVSIIQWIMLIGDEDPVTMRRRFCSLHPDFMGRLWSFLTTVEEDINELWKPRLASLQLHNQRFIQ